MSGKSIRNYKNAFPDDIDPCLAEWSQIQLAPIRDDDSENRHQGSLPYFSPYATYFKPKYTSPGDAAKRGPASYVSRQPVLWLMTSNSLVQAVTR